jgi:endonuclease VIII
MPEGDTIRVAANRIGSALIGREIESIETPHPRHLMDAWPDKLAGRKVRAVDTHGKHLLMRFEGGLTLHSHLRMSGAWAVHRRGERWRRAPRRAWLVMRSEGTEVVQFDGPVLELMSDARLRSDPRLARLGPDVIGSDFDAAVFLRRLREDDPTRPIGDALLDQRTIAGIGNLWKAEACFAAGLDPWRATGEVSDEQVMAAVGFAREHMSRSAREGFPARPKAVYRRAGMACERCGTPIRQRGQWEDNRLTFWCPGCQS